MKNKISIYNFTAKVNMSEFEQTEELSNNTNIVQKDLKKKN
jgi:hypothetical protein